MELETEGRGLETLTPPGSGLLSGTGDGGRLLPVKEEVNTMT